MKKIAMSCDHAGYQTKEKLKTWLQDKGYEVEDFGTYSTYSCDYPDFAHPMAESVESKKSDMGISLCGSGNGINMAANKHQGIRSALCWKKELAELARLHNDANICAIPARFVSVDEAKEIVEKFLNTGFEGGRHIPRVNKIPIL
ncbi:MAG: ribose 5-phosphate isomerase B [Bacteroidales bacterium]|nr:ribose 5-phosphate isomerase B [Bacteroidales bacterium]MCF8458104.1 ribose 5-phosphate isomerase B [Bacteroidales bacterium]